MSAPSASQKINFRAIYFISPLFKTPRFLQEFRAKFGLTSLSVRIAVRKLFSSRRRTNYRLNLHRTFDMLLLFFASSLCKSFRVRSTIIDPGYHIILLSDHPRFDSNNQTVPRKSTLGKYPHQNDLPTRSSTIYHETMQN